LVTATAAHSRGIFEASRAERPFGSPEPGRACRYQFGAYGSEGTIGDLGGSPSAYPVLTKTDHPKVPAAREQRPYLTATVAADHRDMTSMANAAQAPGEAGP